MGMITAFKLLAELRRTFTRGKKRGSILFFFLIPRKRSYAPKQAKCPRRIEAEQVKNILFFSLF